MTPSEREEIEKVARECVSHNMECVLLSQHDRHEGLEQLRYNIEKAIIAQVEKARAEAMRIQIEYRKLLWLSHGHSEYLYGDDGEMQCQRCVQIGHKHWDWKNAPLNEVEHQHFLLTATVRRKFYSQRVCCTNCNFGAGGFSEDSFEVGTLVSSKPCPKCGCKTLTACGA